MSKAAEYGYVYEALADKKGADIVGLELGDSSAIADVFILVTGNSEVHMKTLMEAAEEALEKNGRTVRTEGESSSNWRLLDGGDVAVHIFSHKGREFYKIEKLWADAELLRYEYKE